jgi:hypothetical protein
MNFFAYRVLQTSAGSSPRDPAKTQTMPLHPAKHGEAAIHINHRAGYKFGRIT